VNQQNSAEHVSGAGAAKFPAPAQTYFCDSHSIPHFVTYCSCSAPANFFSHPLTAPLPLIQFSANSTLFSVLIPVAHMLRFSVCNYTMSRKKVCHFIFVINVARHKSRQFNYSLHVKITHIEFEDKFSIKLTKIFCQKTAKRTIVSTECTAVSGPLFLC